RGKTPERLVRRVNEIPVASDLAGLGENRLHPLGSTRRKAPRPRRRRAIEKARKCTQAIRAMQSRTSRCCRSPYNWAMPAERLLDPLITAADRALRSIFAEAKASRPTPGKPGDEASMSEAERRHAAGLMRVNHAGEVAAQALYHGQAAVARSPETREMLLKAAREEADHLAWCETRLEELHSRPS